MIERIEHIGKRVLGRFLRSDVPSRGAVEVEIAPAIVEEFIKEDISQIYRTHPYRYLTSKAEREKWEKTPVHLCGYVPFMRKGNFWQIGGISRLDVPIIAERVRGLPDALWRAVWEVPATGELMKRAKKSPLTKRGVWGMIAFGINDQGEVSPPILFSPNGFSPDETLRIMIRVEEMRRSCT